MNTQTKAFVPGPWTARDDAVFAGECCIATLDGGFRDPAPDRANALLMAAAPDLWSIGYAADRCLSMAFGYARELGRHDEANHFSSVQAVLRGALAKAEGRAIVGEDR